MIVLNTALTFVKSILMYKKRYGQNFLINDEIASKIVDLADIDGQNILEIGPGNLALSNKIFKKKAKKYVAIEIDNQLCEKFNSTFLINNAQILNIDALNFDEVKFFNNEKFIIISNLPFNISTQLLVKWLKIQSQNKLINKMILMFQKELADRIIAKFHNKYYGRISIITSAFFDAKIKIHVKKNDFFPRPKVDASVIEFLPLKKNRINFNNFKKLEDLTFLFFNARRKKNRKKILKIFNQNQIEKYSLNKFYDLRPEDIDPNTYYSMCSFKN